MAKKDEINLDDLDLDNFDFDIPEFDGDGVEDTSSRKPIERVLKGVVHGAKNELASKASLRAAMSLAMPEGYSLAADTLENIATDTRSLYDKVTGESPELVRSSKSFGRKAMNMLGNKVLPKKVADRLNAALETDDDYKVTSDAQYRREQEESELAALAEIFKAKAAADEERSDQDAVENVERKALEQARFKSNIQALNAINRSMARLVGYQDKVTIRYQQKMLEFSYRQYATTKQLTDLMSVATQKQQQLLETIRHNTALPEAVKIRGSEMFGQLAKQRLMGSGLNSISNWSQNYTNQMMSNIQGMVNGFLDPLKEVQTVAEDMDKVYLGGRALGASVAGAARDHVSMFLSPFLEKNKRIAMGGEKLRGMFSGLPQKVNEYAQSQSDNEGFGFKSVMNKVFKSFLPQFSLDARTGGDSISSLDEMATFDKLSRRSLIEVIPGYLAEIAHWTKTTATGEEGERQVYNLARGGFTSRSEQLKDIQRHLLPRQERESLRSAADDFLKMIGADGMSMRAQRVLKLKLLDELANGKDLKPDRLSNPDSYPGEDPGVVEEITETVIDAFGLDSEGKRTDMSYEGRKRFNDISDQFYRMSSMVPALGDRTRILSDFFGKDTLRQLGFIRRDGREDTIDFNKYWSNIFDDDSDAEPDKTGATQSRKDGDNLRSLLPGRIAKLLDPAGDHAARAVRADVSTVSATPGLGRKTGLERYLGDKSTLLTLIRESRDFHSETVELLKGISETGFGGPGGYMEGFAGRMQGSSQALHERFKHYRNLAGDKASSVWKQGKDKYHQAVTLGKDIWMQGDDHPLVTEAKLKAGEYRDVVTGKVLKSWDEISGDVTDLQGRVVMRYRDFMENAYVADKKGKFIKRAADLTDRFKSSRAGAMTAAAAAQAQHHLATLGGHVNDIRNSESLGEAADKLGNKAAGFGKAAQREAIRQKRTFRPRMNRLMRKFKDARLGGDISSELTGDHKEDMLTLAIRNVQLQYETLNEVTREKIRKGSFQDLASRAKKTKDNLVDGAKEKLGASKLGEKGLLAALLAKMQGGDDDEAGIFNSIGDLFGGDSEGKRKRTRARRAGRKGIFGKAKNLMGAGLDKLGIFGKGLKASAKGLGTAASLGWGATKLLGKGSWGAAKLAGRILTSPVTRMVAGTGLRMAAGALLGAAGLVSAPVLAGLAIGGAVIGVGAMAYSFFKEKIPPLTRLRMTQYGIDPVPDSMEVKTLLQLEEYIGKYTTVDPSGKAQVDMQSMSFEPIAQLFKINMDVPPEENELFQRVKAFVTGRFAAVYLTWIGNYHVLNKSFDLTKIDEKLTGKVALEFVGKVSMSDRSDALNAMIGPFEDDELEMDSSDVEKVIKDVKREIESAAVKSAVDKVAKTTAAATAAGTMLPGQDGLARKQAAAQAKADLHSPSTSSTPAAKPLNSESKTTTANVTGMVKASMTTGATVAGGAGVVAALSKLDQGLNDGRSVRYRVYGLTEMVESKVNQLAALEAYCFATTRYDKDGQAELADVNTGMLRAEKIFAPIGEEADRVYIWFHRRFLPAYLTFCTGVRARANIDAQTADTRLPPEQLVEVLRETATARDNAGISVWEITASPWPGYYLNEDSDSVKEPLYNLSLKIKDKILSEKEAISKGRRRGKDGELLKEDPTQTNRPNTAGQSNTGSNGSANTQKENGGDSWWSKTKDFFGFGKKDAQQGSTNSSGQPVAPGGASTLKTGTPVSHPGGGTGGNINDIPEPQGDGWEANRATLMAAANMVGVDPALAASIAGVESNFRPNALPYKNPRNPSAGVLSSAASYYQVIKGTWKDLMAKYAGKYGINPDTTQHDPRANALLGLEYIRENINTIKGVVNRGITDTDVYLAHFLGAGGAKKFLSAPPGDLAVNHVGRDQARSNPAIFYDRNGRPRTVADVYNDFDKKLTKHRKQDAAQVAQGLLTGSPVLAATDTTTGGSSGGATTEPAIDGGAVAADTSVPSMVKPVATPAANTVADNQTAPSATGLAEQANTRQTQSTVAPLAVAAKNAEVQTASQTKASSDTFGGVEANIGRLVSVNESQLEQLITLVSLVKGGAMPTPGTLSEKSELMAGTGTTRQNPSINTARPAPKGTVSVGRMA